MIINDIIILMIFLFVGWSGIKLMLNSVSGGGFMFGIFLMCIGGVGILSLWQVPVN